MSEIAQTLINCFEALSDISGQNIEEANETLNQIFSDPSSIQELIQLIYINGIDEKYRRNSVVNIGRLFKKYFQGLSDEDQASLFVSLLNLYVFPNSRFVRHYIRDFVEMGMKPAFLSITSDFLTQLREDLNDITIEASLYVLSMVLTYQEEDLDNITPMSIPLIEAGLNSQSNDTRLAAILHGLVVANLINTEEGSQLLARYTEEGIQLLVNYVTSNDMFSYGESLCDLVKGMRYFFEQEPENIDTNRILMILLDLLSKNEIIIEFRKQIQILSYVLIQNSIDSIAENEEAIQTVLQVFFQNEGLNFDPEEHIYLIDNDIFSTICEDFALYPDVLEMMWNTFESISESPEGFYTMLVALSATLQEGCDFYQSKITDLSQILIQGVSNECLCLNEAAAECIEKLAISQKKQIKSVLDELVHAILERLSNEPNTELVKSIDSIVCSAEEIGPIFSDIFNALSELYGVEDLPLHDAILSCLYSLIRFSPKQARHFFQPISELCFQILSSQDEYDEFKGKAISILSFLIESSPKLFEPLFSEFHNLVVQNLDSEDLTILKESITAYGHLLIHFVESEQIQSSISDVYAKIIDFAGRDISQREETEHEIFTGEDDPEVEDFDSKVEPVINVVVSAIRVATYILSAFPQMIASDSEQILDIIQKQYEVGDSDCIIGCAEGCNNLIQGVQKAGYNQDTQPILSRIAFLLSEIAASDLSQSDGAGSAFTGISDIIAGDEVTGILCCYEYLGSILGSVRDVFKGERTYQQGKTKYIEELHQPAMRVVREIIAAMKDKSVEVIADLIPIFNEHVENISMEMRDLVLQFFGDLCYWATNAVDDELKGNTFILAFDAIEKRSSAIGFGCIKQLAEKSPQFILEKLDDILGLIKAQLEINEDNPTESLQSIQDNAVSALAMIAMNILKNNFPFNDFLPIALSKMPPQLEAEENDCHIDFFFWLYNCAEQLNILEDNIQYFAAVPVKLFSDPIDSLEDLCVSKDNIGKMLQALKSFSSIPNFESFINEVCENDEFKVESVVDALNS